MADIRINSLPSTATSFNTDDYIAIDGASGGTRKMLAATLPLTDVTFGSSGPSAKSSIAARAARQGLVFDGTAAANSVTAAALGTGDFTISWWQNVQNNANGYGTLLSGASGPLIQNFDGSGRLQIIRGDGVGGSLNTSSAVVTGKWEFWTIARTSGTATWYKNGVADSSGLLGSDFTGNSYIWGQGGTYKIQGSVSGCLIYNRALSAAEVVALYEAGVPAGADYNTASNTSIITGANSDFSSDTGYWIKTGTASIGSGVCTLPGVSSIYRAGLTTVGKRYRLTATLSGGSVTITNADLVTYGTISGAGTGSLEFTAQTAAAIQIVNYTGSITIDNVLLVPVGLLLAPDAGQAGGGLTWYDTSGNAANITLPASGVTWNVPSSRYLGGNWTTSGNLTVSGTGTSTFAGAVGVQTAAATYGGGVGQFYIRDGTTPAKRLFMGYDTVLDGGYIVTEQTGVANKTLFVQPGGGATTIGGNLTVSGTGTSTIGGDLTVTGTGGGVSSIGRVGLNGIGPAGVLSITSDAKTAADAIGLTFLGKDSANNAQTYAAIRALIEDPTSTSEDGALQLFTVSAGTVAEKARLTGAGNYLVGTTTDGGNGRIQLATHTTSAGGIGFGTDTALYRRDANNLGLVGSGKTMFLYQDATSIGLSSTASFAGATSGIIFNDTSKTITVYSGGSTFLSADSSQNATFAQGIIVQNNDCTLYRSSTSTLTLNNNFNVGGLLRVGGSTPASASATGVAGTITWDASYIYVCTAANTWKRVAIATWP